MPQTPTGQRQYEKASMGDYRGAPISHKEVDAIEAEAAAMERKRLRLLVSREMPRKPGWPEFGPLSDGKIAARAAFEMATDMVLDLLADPTP